MPGLPLRPIITYGSPSTVIDLSRPQKWWGYKTQLVGGSRKSSAGIPESFTIREDNMSMLRLRVHECELLDVRAWILDCWRRSATFTFQYDALDPYTTFTCYLDAPTYDDGWEPQRMTSPDFPQFWEVAVTIRNVNAIPIFVGVTGDCGPTGLVPIEFIISGLDASALPNGASRDILSIAPVPASFPYSGIVDPSTASDFTPVGFPAPDVTYTSINPIFEWITRTLSAGYILPSVAQIGGTTTGSPAFDWNLQDAFLVLKHMRDLTELASFTSTIASFGWLGGGDIVSVTFPGITPIKTEDDDQLLLQAFTRYSPKAGGDSSGRLSLSWGSIFGPLVTTRMYGSANVSELP